ncbi:MAG: vitamin B12 transporter [Oleispira sp.]|jgi:vitamin B12 transporter
MKKLALITALLPLSSFASIELDTQKVTASKISSENLSNGIIISREDIELLQATNLSEILNSLPGFQVTQQGGNANTQSFVMNGFRSDQILILLNGQRFGSATLGETTYNTIPSHIIERIEIVSNARSAIYGSDALGGVINIVTTKELLTKNTIRLAVGNQHTSQFSADLHKQYNDLSLHLSGFTERTEGFDVQENDMIDENDTDGSERHALNFDASYKLSTSQKIIISSQNIRGTVDYDSDLDFDGNGDAPKNDYQQQVSSIAWDYSDASYGINANYSESFDKNWYYSDGTSRSQAEGFITETKSLDLTARAQITKSQSLLLVSDYREDDISQSDADYDKKKGSINGIGLSHSFNSDSLNSEVGIRRDESSQFNENFSYSLSTQWFPLSRLSLIAAINTGFKAPSFNELYFPFVDYGFFGTYQGNEDLTPEKSLNRRVEIQYTKGQSSYKASYQLSHIEDLIQYQNIGNNTNIPVNVSQALIRNTLVSWDYDWSNGFSSQASYEWSHAVNLETHNKLARQSPRIAKLNLNYIKNQYSAGSNIRYLSESYNDAGNNTLLAAYTLIDAYGDLTVNENLSFGIRINNVTNKEYQSVQGYPAQERTYLVNGTFTF